LFVEHFMFFTQNVLPQNCFAEANLVAICLESFGCEPLCEISVIG
jgi:hypothetical protein